MSDRYTVLGSIAKGGMGIVYLGRMAGSAGFSRLVAIKRLHRELAAERGLVAMLVDEARMASRVRHANVIDTLDLVVYDGALSLVLEYIEGDSLSALVKRSHGAGEKVPLSIAMAIMYGVLRGLDAAHEARSEDGAPLGLVHRDVSPHNVLVGVDGIPRVIDFGVAKALGRIGTTKPGEVRGKYSYMSPEQLRSRPVTRQADVYSAGVMLWELLAHRRLFSSDDWRVIINDVLKGTIPNPSEVDADVPAPLDAIVKKATARELGERYLSAQEFLAELKPFPRASDDEVGAWVRRLAAEELAKRHRLVQANVASAESHTIDDLMQDLRRSRGHAPARLVPEISTAPPAEEVPVTTVLSVYSQLETATTDSPTKDTVGPQELAPPKRYGRTVGALAIMSFFALLATAVIRARAPTDDATPSSVASAVPAVSPAVAPSASVLATLDGQVDLANVRPATAVPTTAVAASAPSVASATVRSESSSQPPASAGRRPRPAPVAAPYDPGNFR